MTVEKRKDIIGAGIKLGTFILTFAAVSALCWSVFAVPQIDKRAECIAEKKAEVIVVRNDKDHERILERLENMEKSLARMEGKLGTRPYSERRNGRLGEED